VKFVDTHKEFDPDLGRRMGIALDILATLVQAYEAKHSMH
jgi:hypothetical protein